MTTEERLLRLENAFATLSELAAKSNERHDSNDDRLDKLLTLALSADERMDESNARQSAFENNLAALSQIVIELGQAQRRADERMDESNARQSAFENNLAALSQIVVELAQAQRRTDERLDRFAALVERHISEPGGEA